MPTVSVILPAYNVEKYIAKSISSVLSQTFTDFELLVIIDGSPDNSKTVAESFSDKRISIFEKENGGLSDARNYGLKRARGKYVYFMDSDDWIEPELLEDNLKILNKKHLDFLVFGYIQDNEDANGKVTKSINFQPKVQSYSKNEENVSIDQLHIGLLGYAWNKIYKKKFLDQNRFVFQKGISLVEDILFNAPIYTISKEIHFNQKSYYHYVNRDEETLMKKFYPDAFKLKVLKNIELEKFFKSWKVKDEKNILSEILFNGIRFCINNLYSSKPSISLENRKQYIREIVLHPRYKYLKPYYTAKNLKAKIFFFALGLKSDRLLRILKKKKI